MKVNRLEERYDLSETLGFGGMALVYRAWDRIDQRWVAINFSRPPLSAVVRQRFHAEAEIVSKIDHPHVVKFLNYSGQSSSKLWIVMELLEGCDLVDYMKRSANDHLSPLHTMLILNDLVRQFRLSMSEGDSSRYKARKCNDAEKRSAEIDGLWNRQGRLSRASYSDRGFYRITILYAARANQGI